MVATLKEYHDYLISLQADSTRPAAAIPFNPRDQKIYDLNLNTRTIEVPEFLSVERDHRSEIIYFKCNRFFDNVDLVNTTCLVEYYNTGVKDDLEFKEWGVGQGVYTYKVPFYDVQTFAAEDKIVIPWMIEGPATVKEGEVIFALKFFVANELDYDFVLNTKPAKGKVLHGIEDALRQDVKYKLEPTVLEQVYTELTNSEQLMEQHLQNATIKWIDV